MKIAKFLRNPYFVEQPLKSCFRLMADMSVEVRLHEKFPIVFSNDIIILYNHSRISLLRNSTVSRVFVSATRRRRDIKIPLCLSAPLRKSLI